MEFLEITEYVRQTEAQLREVGILRARSARRHADDEYAAVLLAARSGAPVHVIAGSTAQAQHVFDTAKAAVTSR